MQQGLHGFAQIALHDEKQLVQREIDAVIGHPALRKIVGADAITAVAAANQTFACGRLLGCALAALFLLQASL